MFRNRVSIRRLRITLLRLRDDKILTASEFSILNSIHSGSAIFDNIRTEHADYFYDYW